MRSEKPGGRCDDGKHKEAATGFAAGGVQSMNIDRQQGGGELEQGSRRTYVAPEIQTFTAEEFMNVLGPAQGYGGGGESSDEKVGRGFRLFPGLR